MAEVVGLVASIITLIQVTHAVAEGVRRAIDLYRAPEEIRVLQVSTSRPYSLNATPRPA